MEIEWEKVDKNIWRSRTPSGWLVVNVDEHRNESICFVLDPSGGWLNSQGVCNG